MNKAHERASVLERFVKIMDCFIQDRSELGVREVSRQIGLSTSTTGRLMLSMKELGILHQNASTRSYSLGSRVLTWAGIYLATSDIRNVAYPHMLELHAQTGETISLYILDGNERLCIERLESTHNVRFVAPRVGRHLPLHAGSAGKVLLAFLSDEQRETILTGGPLVRLTEKTIVSIEALRKELVKIKAQGYALSDGEWILEASGIAAPIFDRKGEVTAALTISGPSQRFTPESIPAYTECLLDVAGLISEGMGYRSRAASMVERIAV